MEVSQEDRKFIEENIINFETVSGGWIKSLDGHTLDRYAEIHTKHIGAFVLNKWCPECCFEMVKRLKNWWDNNK
jgi:hypothetical protein